VYVFFVSGMKPTQTEKESKINKKQTDK